MPKYVIEREIPGAGQFTGEDLKGMSQKSCSVLVELGPNLSLLGDKMNEVEYMTKTWGSPYGLPSGKIIWKEK